MIPLHVCLACQLQLPPPVDRCPSCGGGLVPEERSGRGSVLAATELTVPAEGWKAPHRLVWVDLEGGGRVLALPEGDLPPPGTLGQVEIDAQGRHLFRPTA